MTILGRLRESRASLEDPNVPITGSTLLNWLGAGARTDSGVSVSERGALRSTVVWRCVNLIANTAASLPLHAYRAGTYEQVASPLLANPHPELTPLEFWRLSFVHRLLNGNFYAEKVRDGVGRIQWLYPLDPTKMKVGRAADQTKMFEYTRQDGRTFHVTSDEVFHLPGLGFDGIIGYSPVYLAAQAIAMSLAAEKYGAKFYGQGSLLSGILSVDSVLTQEQAETAKVRWREKLQGPDAAYDVAVLDNGAKFQPLTMPNNDAQFIESRGFQVSEICRLYGVPPHMVGDVEKSTSWGTGIEQQSIGYVKYTLQPDWLAPTEARITRELLRDPNVYAKYKIEGLLRGDSTARANFYNVMRNIGAFSVNDIRSLEDMPGVGPDGDTRLQPLNMAPLGSDETQNPPTGEGAS